MTGAPPKVFISYSHDTVTHQERVLDLADRLRAYGINAEIDQYNDSPAEGWPRWCERQIEAADFVLMVCTETYHRRVKGDEKLGTGLGVVWEAAIIRQLLYDAGAISTKFVPVLFSDASDEQIPRPIKGWTRYVVDTEDGYEGLYRRLSGQPRLPRPALGTIRPMPTRRRQWPTGTMEAASSSPASPQPPSLHDAAGSPAAQASLSTPLFHQKRWVALFGAVAVVAVTGVIVWPKLEKETPPPPVAEDTTKSSVMPPSSEPDSNAERNSWQRANRTYTPDGYLDYLEDYPDGRYAANVEFMLGQIYMRGHGVAKDLCEAARWFRKAADRGDTGAQRNLEIICEQEQQKVSQCCY